MPFGADGKLTGAQMHDRQWSYRRPDPRDPQRHPHALMLYYLRFPGCALRAGERPPMAWLEFVTADLDIFPAYIDEHLAADRNWQWPAIGYQEQLRLRAAPVR
jgi:hypothetical protein